MISSYLREGILSRAVKARKISVKTYNPRDFVTSKYKGVDDKPYGGGPGMVMNAEPVLKSVKRAVGRKRNVLVLMTSPRGKKFDNKLAGKLASDKKVGDIVIISGRYEGIDARVKKILRAELGAANVREVSIGDYVLSGGELPALVMVDAIARQIPGVLGNKESIEEVREASAEYYTRPEALKWAGKEHKVPKVLLSGNHKDIEAWRKKKNK